MTPRTYLTDRHEETEGFEIAKFFVVAALLTGALTIVAWLVATLFHRTALFTEFRATVVLAALATSLLTSSAIFDHRERSRRQSNDD